MPEPEYTIIEKRQARKKAYNASHAAEIRAYKQAYNAAHAEEIRAKRRVWRIMHQEEIRLKNAAWQAIHAAEKRAASAARRITHLEEIRAQENAYNATHPEERRAYQILYRAAHREKAKAAKAAWAKANPEQYKAHKQKHRALKARAIINDFTAAQWRALQEAFDHCFAYCGKRAKGHLTQDHITALSKGGSHTLANIVPACRPCNSRKHTGPVLSPVQPMLLL